MSGSASSFLPILLMAGAFAVLIFFMQRKQKRQVAAARAMQDSIVAGTRVSTTSGLHGTVTAVADDTVELEIAPGVRTTWVRAAVREIVVAVPLQDSFDDSMESETPGSAISLDKRAGDVN